MNKRTTALLRQICLPLLAAIAIGLSTSFARADWPGWRGPASNGSITTGNYPTRWGEDGITWKVALPGKGGSTPIVWQKHIYLTTPADGQDAVLALDFSGKQTWLTQLGPESSPKHKTLGSSCNSSPATDGKALFVYFRSGHFAALEFDGTIRWKINLADRFGPEKLFWDQGSSPVVTDQHVILTRLHEGESWIAGFDKGTGDLRWQQKRNYETPIENNNGYTTPIIFEHAGRKAVLVWGADHLTAHDPTNGSLLWSCGQFNPEGTGYWPAIASPVIHGNVAVVPVGRDDRPGQAHLHGIRLDGRGDVTSTHRVWMRDDVGVFVPTLAEYNGRVFLLRHRGEVVCLDPATGKTIWSAALSRGTASYYASPVIANGVLYAAREDGVVFAARVKDKFELLSENPMGERVVASPAVSDDRLLIRGDKHLFCIQQNRATNSTVTVCSDGGAGGYEAFPDICRLADGRLQCIFYASYTHVGVPNERWPRGGKIGVCWSKDEGRTWSEPETLFDSPADDRDPSITQLKDGRLVCSFFNSAGAQVIEARAPAGPWSAPRLLGEGLGVSSPVRELSDGTLIVGTYSEKDGIASGNTIRSLNGGQSWEAPVTIDNAGQYLDAETDVIELKNGGLYAALRGGKGAPMNGSRSRDRGRSWDKAQPLGFVGHCPYLHRPATGEIILAYRQPVKGPTYGTALRFSRDEARSWSEAILVDSVIGAYPSMVNLKDGSVLLVYYEEGAGSNIRARKFRIEGDQVNWLNF